VSTDETLTGLGLVVVLAVASQLVARRLRIPAIVVLLPAGFLAGVATDDIHPANLLGSLYQPFVSLAVGIILFEAGLKLPLSELAAGAHRLVVKLVGIGIVVTLLGVFVTCLALFGDVDRRVCFLLGAILVVSGPTVVLPMLAFIRPPQAVRSLLKWEGVLIDPFGAILGVLVFQGISSSAHGGAAWHPGEFTVSLAVGTAFGVLGALVLWLLLSEVQENAPRQAVAATLMVVVGAIVAADVVRDDAGFVAATLMGVVLGNQRRIEMTLTAEFDETLVQLLIGVLFVLIASSVSPNDLSSVLAGSIALVVVMVLVIRPLVVALATWRSPLTLRERALVAWIAPRGIVAGATASAFGVSLTEDGVKGADKILPIVFVVIFGTVVLYGLTAPIVARLLGLAGGGSAMVLVVSGNPWARQLALALQECGVAVRMWAGSGDELEAAQAAGLRAERGRMMVDALSREAELEDVTHALLLTRSDDFNAFAAAELRGELGSRRVFRVAPDGEASDLLPPLGESGILGGDELTWSELSHRLDAGGRITRRQPGAAQDGDLALAVVGSDGKIAFAADGHRPQPRAGDAVIALTAGQPA